MASLTARLDLPALARRAWEQRRVLLRFYAGVAVLAVAVVFLLPPWFSSSVTMVPAPKDGLSLDLSGAGAGALGGASLNLGQGPTPQDQLKMVVSSRAVADSVIARFGLIKAWDVKHIEDAREKLAEHVTITTPKEGQVVVAVEAKQPALARDMAAAFAQYASSESVRLKTMLAAQRRVYLEARMHELDGEIENASTKVRAFEEKHGAYSLPDQAKETMDAAGQLQAQVVLLQTELAAARRYFTDQSAEVHMLTDRIAELQRQLDKLARQGGQFILQGTALPALKQEYLELSREQLSLVAVSELLRRFYEQARVEESNPVSTFSLLDAADLPEKHSRPQRALTIVLALAAAFALSLVWVHGGAKPLPLPRWLGGRRPRAAAPDEDEPPALAAA